MSQPELTSPWSRLRARWWYLWGVSLCYSGLRGQDRSYYRAGVESFGRATRLWPTFAQAYYRSGLIRGRELGEYQAAISDLDLATALRPEWPDPYLQRGLFHRFNNNPQAALGDLRRYIELAPPGYWREEAGRQAELLRSEIEPSAGDGQ